MKAPLPEATSTLGETISPPLTRQLSTTFRERGRYHAMLPTNRVNCCSGEEPMYLELWVSSSCPIRPRVGSIWLFTRGKLAVAVRVASIRFCLRISVTSVVHALKNAQKLWAVAWVRP
jgi:hypothetical protein